MNEPVKCVVEYKTGIVGGHLYGYRFSKLQTCCDAFAQLFLRTGNAKVSNFNHPNGEWRDGLNFTTFHGVGYSVALRISGFMQSINYCPFCGAEIEVKQVKTVRLEREYEEKFVGYEEIEQIMPSNTSLISKSS